MCFLRETTWREFVHKKCELTHHRGSSDRQGERGTSWRRAGRSRKRDARKGERRLKDVRRPREEREGCPTLFSTKIIAIYARNPLYSRVVSNYNCSGARARFQRLSPLVLLLPFVGLVVSPTLAASRGPLDARFSLFRLRSSPKPRKTAHSIPPIIASARRVTPATCGPRPKAEPGTTPVPRSTWTRR